MISGATDPDEKEIEEQYMMSEYRALLGDWIKMRREYFTNMPKAYAVLWTQCSMQMKSKIEAMADFESTIRNNPISLLIAIQQHALDFQENRYDMEIISAAFANSSLSSRRKRRVWSIGTSGSRQHQDS